MYRRLFVLLLAATVVAVVVGCGTKKKSKVELTGGQRAIVDATYQGPGGRLAGDWKVPRGTRLLGTAFPAGATSFDQGFVEAETTVVGDPYDALRDLIEQAEHRGLRIVSLAGPNVCETGKSEASKRRLNCSFTAIDDKRARFLSADLAVGGDPAAGEPVARLTVSVRVKPDDSTTPNLTTTESEYAVPAKLPAGAAPIKPPKVDRDRLVPGAKIPFFGRDEVFAVPSAAYLLAPPTNPSATYGLAGMFVAIKDPNRARDAVRKIATSAASRPEAEETTRHHDGVEYRLVHHDGSGGGCDVDVVSWTTQRGLHLTYLNVVCD